MVENNFSKKFQLHHEELRLKKERMHPRYKDTFVFKRCIILILNTSIFTITLGNELFYDYKLYIIIGLENYHLY